MLQCVLTPGATLIGGASQSICRSHFLKRRKMDEGPTGAGALSSSKWLADFGKILARIMSRKDSEVFRNVSRFWFHWRHYF
jgi:hypothetical protein